MTEALDHIAATGRRIRGQLLEMLLPPRCFACGADVATQGDLCGECWSGLTFITDPQCVVCGLPFEYDRGGDTRCGACLQRQPLYDGARAALAYNDGSRPLILALKHGDRSEGTAVFARWMANSAANLPFTPDIVVPVPLHRWRLWRRRFNQSALLATRVADLLNAEVDLDSLQRIRNTPSQGRLKGRERHRNVRGAFAVRPHRINGFRDRSVLLVDDVMTTGATVEACARVLKRAGATSVWVVALARVVRPRLVQ